MCCVRRLFAIAMSMEITPAWASVGVAAFSFVGGSVANWLNGRIADVKNTQALLFTKYDNVGRELQNYKLHVAETYVGIDAMEKALAPINATLKELRDELRDSRNDK